MSNVFLVGMPGSGKTTIGRALARRLGMIFTDCDKELIARTGVSIATIFEIEGESGFRARESTALVELTQRDGIVLATGGGAVLGAENRRLLRERGKVIYLHASLDNLWQRTRRDTARPLLQTADPRATLGQLLGERDPLYREIADLVVDTSTQSVARLIDEIVARLETPQAST